MLTATAVLAPPAARMSASPQAVADEESRSAREQMRNNAQQLAKVKVPMAVEPAFHFKA